MAMVQETPKETVRSSRSSATLKSRQFSRKKKDSLTIASKTKRAGESTALSQKNKHKEQTAACIQTPFKSVASDHLLKKALAANKAKCKRKSTIKSQKRVRSKSFPENIPIDVLALSSVQSRKTKSGSFQVPGKNTLKRKRYVMNAMKKADEEYEDDIFESNIKEFDYFKQIFPDSLESDTSGMTTPKLGFLLTPRIRCKTPVYKDCFSPTQYALSRKVAEECWYRNKKRRGNIEVKTPEIPEKKKLEFVEVLNDVCKAQEKAQTLTEDKSVHEDNYFSDLEL